MRNKFLLLVALFFGIGVAVFAKSQTVTIIPATGLENAVIQSNENSSVACVMFAKHLRYGDGFRTGKQNEVRELQEALRKKGYFNYPESTGYFGIVTRDAVKKYQRDNGIINTGNVFSLTVGQLKKDFCSNKNIDKTPEDNLSKGPVNSYCKVWNDGCNTCFKSSSTSTDAGCTKMYCEKQGEPYCKEYFENAPITKDCKSWYDGCNWCSKNSDSEYAMCTMRACLNNAEPAYCTSYFNNSSNNNLIKDCPSEKIINLMPIVCVTTPCSPVDNSYYIYNGQRKEISDFDADYVKYHCKVPETKVY